MSSPSEATVADLLALAIQAEQKAQILYRELASRFHHVPQAARLWQEMLQDEVRHQEILEEVGAQLTPEQLGAPVDMFVFHKAAEIVHFSPQQRLAAVQTLADACRLAHDLEFSEVNTVFKFILLQLVPCGMKRDLAVIEMDQHLARLEEFGKSRLAGDYPCR